MNSSLQESVLHALSACLRPLARVLLRSGIGYKQFSQAAKMAFVEEATVDKDRRGRDKNTSRVAVSTGLSRKEVARIKKALLAAVTRGDEYSRASSRSSHAARVLQLWHVDTSYISPNGQPTPLPFSGDSVSFCSLVKLAGGDVPPGAVRAELVAATAIDELPDGLLAPLRRYFIPSDVGEDLIVGLTHILAPVLEGLAHNTGAGKADPFIQRIAYSDCLIPEAIPLFKQLAHTRAAEFLQQMDEWLVSNETATANLTAEGTRVGVGVFYYQGARMAETGGQASDSGELDVTLP